MTKPAGRLISRWRGGGCVVRGDARALLRSRGQAVSGPRRKHLGGVAEGEVMHVASPSELAAASDAFRIVRAMAAIFAQQASFRKGDLPERAGAGRRWRPWGWP